VHLAADSSAGYARKSYFTGENWLSGEQGLGFDGWKRFHLFKRYCGGVNAGWRVSHRAIARPAMKTIVERKLI
jgi:hypothetical protein